MLISQAQADTVLVATAVAIPVLTLTYLATDRERFLLSRGMSGQPLDAVKPDPRLLDLEAEANPKNEKQEKVETLQELPWRLAVERMDAFLVGQPPIAS